MADSSEKFDARIDHPEAHCGMSPAVEPLWGEEVERRITEVDAGEAELIPVEVTLAKMRAMLD